MSETAFKRKHLSQCPSIDYCLGYNAAVEDFYKFGPPPESERIWELFSLISAVWYGKDAYFQQDDGMVYSRISGESMTFDQAVDEFVCELHEDN